MSESQFNLGSENDTNTENSPGGELLESEFYSKDWMAEDSDDVTPIV